MRKIKIEIKGEVSLFKNGEFLKRGINSLGSVLMPLYNGRMNGELVNNRLLIIQMQSDNIHFQKVFHYKNYKEKNEIIDKFILENSNKVCQYIEDNFSNVEEVKFNPILNIIYDMDYCELPIQEAQNDLTKEELKEVMINLSKFQPATHLCKKREGKNVFFE